MAEILLTHSYFLPFDRKQMSLGQPWAPLGTLYAASVLRAAGHHIVFHDVMFEDDPASIEPLIIHHQPALLVIYDDGFNYLTKMCLTNMREAAITMAKCAGRHGVKVIVSSSDATDRYVDYLENGADAVIMGEGELTLSELAEILINGENGALDEIRGIAYHNGESVIVNPKRELVEHPDMLPMPAWDLLTVDRYRSMWIRYNGYFTLNMVTTRGCPYQCIWCAKPIFGNHYHSRSPANVADELHYIIQHFRPDAVWFADDIFGLRPGWISAFEEETSRRGIRIPYTIQTRADLLVSDRQVAPLAGSGCTRAWLGIESGSQKILDAMRKGITIEQVKEASRQLRKAGIEQAFFLQLGFPGEDKKDIDLTIGLLDELMPDDIGISVTYPLPGTKFYEAVKKDLREKKNWTESDDLDMMFRSSFSPRYYKLLHRYIHKRFRFKQALSYLKDGRIRRWKEVRRILLAPYYVISALLFRLGMHLEEKR